MNNLPALVLTLYMRDAENPFRSPDDSLREAAVRSGFFFQKIAAMHNPTEVEKHEDYVQEFLINMPTLSAVRVAWDWYQGLGEFAAGEISLDDMRLILDDFVKHHMVTWKKGVPWQHTGPLTLNESPRTVPGYTLKMYEKNTLIGEKTATKIQGWILEWLWEESKPAFRFCEWQGF